MYNKVLIIPRLKYNFEIPKNTGSNLQAKTGICKSENFLMWLPNWKYMKTSNDEI